MVMLHVANEITIKDLAQCSYSYFCVVVEFFVVFDSYFVFSQSVRVIEFSTLCQVIIQIMQIS